MSNNKTNKDAEEEHYYTLEEAITLYNKIDKPDLTLDELVLLVLGLLDKPINGRVVLHKEIFLLYKELSNKGIKIVNPKFVKYKYGPFSFHIALVIEYLAEDKFINIKNRQRTKLARYELTTKGRKWANKIIDDLEKRLGKDYINNLRELRKGWDQLGHEGILRYVYQNYPDYLEKSVRKKDFIHIDWGVLEA